MAKGFISTDTSSPSLPSKGSMKAAGANVKGSRLNKGGDKGWRGKRGGEGTMGKGYSKSMSSSKGMDY